MYTSESGPCYLCIHRLSQNRLERVASLERAFPLPDTCIILFREAQIRPRSIHLQSQVFDYYRLSFSKYFATEKLWKGISIPN